MASNPFEVLGLNPKIVGTLSSDDLDYVIAAMCKALKVIYHTDRPNGGDRKKFDEIVDIEAMLDRKTKPVEFVTYKNNFTIESKKGKQARLEKENQYWLVHGGAVTDAYIKYISAYNDEKSPGINVRSLDKYELHIFDNVIGVRLNPYKSIKKQHLAFLTLTTKAGKIHRTSYEGEATVARVPIGTVPVSTFLPYGGIIKFLKLVDDDTFHREKVTIDSESVDTQKNNVSEIQWMQYNISNRISTQNFSKIVEHIRPYVIANSLLISVSYENSVPSFYYEGQIMKIKPLGSRS